MELTITAKRYRSTQETNAWLERTGLRDRLVYRLDVLDESGRRVRVHSFQQNERGKIQVVNNEIQTNEPTIELLSEPVPTVLLRDAHASP